ncbi:MAG: hypothetical protein AAGE92_02175 [Cyanobacteria bacterium P01_G01_bin.4]
MEDSVSELGEGPLEEGSTVGWVVDSGMVVRLARVKGVGFSLIGGMRSIEEQRQWFRSGIFRTRDT